MEKAVGLSRAGRPGQDLVKEPSSGGGCVGGVKTSFQELKATGKLPSPSGVGMAILRLTSKEDFSTDELTRLVQSDGALTGRLLKLANTARTAGVKAISTVEVATMRLGAMTVRNVALGFSLMGAHRKGLCQGFDYDNYWSKSLAQAVIAQSLATRVPRTNAGEAFVCGLLAGIGALALATAHPEPYAAILRKTPPPVRTRLSELEFEAFVATHADVSRALLLDWGLPASHADACGLADVEGDQTEPLKGLTAVVWCAARLAEALFSSEDSSAPFTEMLPIAKRIECDAIEISECADLGVNEWRAWGATLEIPTFKAPRFAEISKGGWRAPVHAATPPSTAAVASATSQSDRADPSTKTRGAARLTTASIGPIGGQGALALAVEPNLQELDRLETELKNAGHRVLRTASGGEALKIALEQKPQIVVARATGEGVDGLELCRSLRRCEQGKEMYVLLVTGANDEDRQVEAFEAGADDTIGSSWKPRVLLARLRAASRLLSLQEKVVRDSWRMQEQLAELGVLTRRLELASLTDVLTGIPNRRHAWVQLNSLWLLAKEQSKPFALITLDLDHFKKVNDQHGHDAGDHVLRECASILKSNLRPNEEVCRVGGEEFLVICAESSLDEAARCAERLRNALEQHVINFSSFHAAVTASFGVVAYHQSMLKSDDLLKQADVATYEAKSQGRNRVVIGKPQQVPVTV